MVDRQMLECSADRELIVLDVSEDRKIKRNKETEVAREEATPLSWRRWIILPARVPSFVWFAVALFVVIEITVVVGSVYYAKGIQNSRATNAYDVMKTSARDIEKLLDDQKAPILSVVSLIKLNPHWPSFNATFSNFTMTISEDYSFYEIEACPYGVISAMTFPWLNATGADLYKLKLVFNYQVDLLNPIRPNSALAMSTINQQKGINLVGPWFGDGMLAHGAFALRYNIFLPTSDKDSWDMPPNHAYMCPPSVCYSPDNMTTWWGWVDSVFVWDDIDGGLVPLMDHNLLYSLAPDTQASSQKYLAISDPAPHPSTQTCAPVQVYDTQFWTLCIDDPDGKAFWPKWFPGLVVGVTALALLFSIMAMLLLRSRTQAVTLLMQQVETNTALAIAKEEAESRRQQVEAEGQRMQLLMQRQHELIALFAKDHAGVGSGAEGPVGGPRNRIEEMRVKLSSSKSARKLPAAELSLGELLGEGSFGKVHRGTWRGIEVAVKTMILPAHMSGQEKREKMLIMETAISSALAHPNIVQIFTYFINNLLDNKSSLIDSCNDCLILGSAVIHEGAATKASTISKNSHSTVLQRVHGYEVRLVLEYCDKGCLHDALVCNAFMCPVGLNYKAILDTALDVAKAMVYLHTADVLHGDLKARNVMLKSCSTESRGIVAKVADFGLAVKMDDNMQTHMSNLFQGTPTHMAPELLLHGRLSKAADVYAFGILLWELFTAGSPFKGVPQALLGHQVIHERRRPTFMFKPPSDFAQLVNECWAHEPLERPTFASIETRIREMRQKEEGKTPLLAPYTVPSHVPNFEAPYSWSAASSDAVLPLSPQEAGRKSLLSTTTTCPLSLSVQWGCSSVMRLQPVAEEDICGAYCPRARGAGEGTQETASNIDGGAAASGAVKGEEGHKVG